MFVSNSKFVFHLLLITQTNTTYEHSHIFEHLDKNEQFNKMKIFTTVIVAFLAFAALSVKADQDGLGASALRGGNKQEELAATDVAAPASFGDDRELTSCDHDEYWWNGKCWDCEDHHCPSNSHPKDDRQCYNDYDDCECDSGYKWYGDKDHGECKWEDDEHDDHRDYYKYEGYHGKACRDHSGGYGDEGKDYRVYKSVSLKWCFEKCSDDYDCKAFEYYDGSDKCEIWYRWYDKYESKHDYYCFYKQY